MSADKKEPKFQVNLKKSEIGLCRRCGADPKGQNFYGLPNPYCTHMYSQDKWWLRIDHHREIDRRRAVVERRLPDTVGDLLCTSCAEKHESVIAELLGDMTS